jgi:cullin-4
MKGKKKMLYETLKTETINAVKAHFAPSVAMIKKQIDSLVLREYLERDKVDMNLYRYVA